MFTSFPILVLIPIFAVAAVATWLAGVQLSNMTDAISSRFGLGEALGGIIILAIATNLSNIVVVVSAALTKHNDIAIGNILGGIAIQTVVLVILDGFGLRRKGALTYEAASLQLVLEGVLVIGVLVISIMGTQLPQSLVFACVAPGDLLIAIVWLIGLWLINKARKDLPWQEKGRAPDCRLYLRLNLPPQTSVLCTWHRLDSGAYFVCRWHHRIVHYRRREINRSFAIWILLSAN